MGTKSREDESTRTQATTSAQTTAGQAVGTDVISRNKEAARRVLEAFNTGDTAIIDQVAHPRLFSHTPFPSLNPRRTGLKEQIKLLREQFPDARFEEETILAEKDVVFLRWKMTGTNQGPVLGRAATGKEIVHYGHEILRMEDGMIVEHRDTGDAMRLMDELGMLDDEMRQTMQERRML